MLVMFCHALKNTEMLVTAAKLIGGGAAAAGVGGAGAGIGAVFAGFVIGLSRNPSLEQVMFRFTILGFALSEATALFALMMSFLILFTFLLLYIFKKWGHNSVGRVSALQVESRRFESGCLHSKRVFCYLFSEQMRS